MDVDRRVHRQVMHVLDAPDDLHVFGLCDDRMAGLCDRLQPRTAEPVDRGAGGGKRKVGHQGHRAGHVAAEFAPLLRGPEDQVLDRGGVDTAAFDGRLHHSDRQFIPPEMAKQAAGGMGSADCGATAGDDDGRRLRRSGQECASRLGHRRMVVEGGLVVQ